MQLKMRQAFVLVPTILWVFAGRAVPTDAHTAEKGFAEITAPEVKTMLDEKRAVLVNVLSAIEYEMQHITGSINIPIDKIATSDRLPVDKNTPLVLYCMGLA